MKKSIFLLFLLAFTTSMYTSAQDLDKILKSHFKTIGQEKLLKVKTMQVTGKAVMMGMENPLTMSIKRPDKVKVIVEFQGSEIIQAYDGETVWMINPMTGSAAVVNLTGPEADGLIESGDMDGQLWNWKERGHKLELEGSEEVDGTESFVLKLTKKNGNIDHYFMDTESFLVVKMTSNTIMNGSEMEVVVRLSNYQEVNGVIMPFTIEQNFGGQAGMTIMMEEVKFDVELDDAIFSKPSGN